jgi:hypothetical protein
MEELELEADAPLDLLILTDDGTRIKCFKARPAGTAELQARERHCSGVHRLTLNTPTPAPPQDPLIRNSAPLRLAIHMAASAEPRQPEGPQGTSRKRQRVGGEQQQQQQQQQQKEQQQVRSRAPARPAGRVRKPPPRGAAATGPAPAAGRSRAPGAARRGGADPAAPARRRGPVLEVPFGAVRRQAGAAADHLGGSSGRPVPAWPVRGPVPWRLPGRRPRACAPGQPGCCGARSMLDAWPPRWLGRLALALALMMMALPLLLLMMLALPLLAQDSAEGILDLAHKYQLKKAIDLAVLFVNANMTELNIISNNAACIIRCGPAPGAPALGALSAGQPCAAGRSAAAALRAQAAPRQRAAPPLLHAPLPCRWLAIAQRREQQALFERLRARLRLYCQVVQACALAGAKDAQVEQDPAVGPVDPAGLQRQAEAALARIAEGAAGDGADTRALDSDTQHMLMRATTKVLLKVCGCVWCGWGGWCGVWVRAALCAWCCRGGGGRGEGGRLWAQVHAPGWLRLPRRLTRRSPPARPPPAQVAAQCSASLRRCAELEQQVALAKCADCSRTLCRKGKAHCGACVHKKLYAKKKPKEGGGAQQGQGQAQGQGRAAAR